MLIPILTTQIMYIITRKRERMRRKIIGAMSDMYI